MTDNIYKGCSTCASVHREKSGRLVCAEGRKILNFSFSPPSCWKPKEGKSKEVPHGRK